MPRWRAAGARRSGARARTLLPALALLLMAVSHGFGQVYPTWQGSGTNWSTAANWNIGYANNAQLQWTGGGNATSWNDQSSPQSQWRFYFSGGQAYTLGGNAVSFFDFGGNRGGILSDSSALQTINLNLNFADNVARDMFILTRGSGGLTFGGTVDVTNSVTALGIGGSNSSSVITFNGPITGAKPIIIGTNAFDGGTSGMSATRAVFAGSNSYTGATTVANGSLTISHANALGATNTGTTVASGASLNLSNGITINGEALTLTGSGLSDGGALRSISGSNSYLGLITASSALTRLGAASGATLVVSNVNSGTQELWVVGEGTTIISGGATNSGSGTAFVKFGTAGTAVLVSSNAWSGNEFIREGTVIISNNNALGTGGTTTIGNVSGSSTAATLTLGQNIINSNAIVVQGGGTGVRTLGYQSSGTGTQLGSITLNTNSLAFNVTNNGTLLFGGGVTVNTDVSGNNRFALDGGGTLIVTNNGSGIANSDRYQVRVGNGTLIIGAGTIIARTNVAGLGHAIDLGVNLNNGIVDAVSALRASNGVTISNSIYVSTVNSQARILGASGANATVTYTGEIGLGNAPVTIDSTNGQTVTVSGPITNVSGTGSLVKTNDGLAILSGANTYSGTTTITNGTLRIANNSALGTTAGGTIVGDGATLEFSNNLNVSGEFINLNGSGVGGNGALRNLSGDNTNTGTLTLVSASRIQTESGTTFTQSGTVNNGGFTLTVNSLGTTVVSGAITNTGGVTKDGAGQLTLSNSANNFGVLTINAGTVVISNTAFATGLAGNAGTTLSLNNPNTNTQQFVTDGSGNNSFAGTVGGTSQYVKRGTGTQTFTGTYANTSGIYIDGGSVNFDGSSTSASSLIDIGSALLARQGDTAEFRLGGTSGGRTFTNNFNTFTNSGSATRTLASENTSGVNTISGNITNTAAANGGMIVTNAGGGTLALSGAISGTGALTKTGGGTLALSGNNTYSGATTIGGGTLQIDANSRLGNTNTTLTISNAGTLRVTSAGGITNAITIGTGNGVLSNASSGTVVYSGAITSSGTVLTSAAGSGTNVFTGVISGASENSDFVVDGGTTVFSNQMTFNGPTIITNGGTLSLKANDALPSGSNLVLGGGTFLVGDSSAIYGDENIGTMTLSADSTIDFGTSTDTLTRNIKFAASSSATWIGALTITNWSQATNSESGAYGRVYFGSSSSGLTSGQLNQISFNISGTLYGAKILSDGEVVADLTPIPEPRVYAAAVALLAAVGWRERKRLLRILRARKS